MVHESKIDLGGDYTTKTGEGGVDFGKAVFPRQNAIFPYTDAVFRGIIIAGVVATRFVAHVRQLSSQRSPTRG